MDVFNSDVDRLLYVELIKMHRPGLPGCGTRQGTGKTAFPDVKKF